MRFSTSLVAFVATATTLVSAAPRYYGRQDNTLNLVVLKFADVLEQLESEFYRQALGKFQDADFATAGFLSSQVPIEQFLTIQQDEETHSVVLQEAIRHLGDVPITTCKFNFGAALNDVATMAATARVVEAVGVGAYVGAAPLLTDPVLLVAASTIATVEARHQTILNLLSNQGTAIPNAFDVALTPSEVLALAGPFFDGPCDLGVPANPVLQITNTGAVAPGTKLEFASPAINGTRDVNTLFCQMLLPGSFSSIALPFNDCVVPPDVNGPVAVFITSDPQPLLNNVRDRATTQLVAGPQLAFIDTKPQAINQLARLNLAAINGGAATSTSTRTISPAEASSLIATAAPAATTVASPISPNPAVVPAASPVGSAPNAANTFVGTSADGAITVQGWTA